jgi:hypothetical protein
MDDIIKLKVRISRLEKVRRAAKEQKVTGLYSWYSKCLIKAQAELIKHLDNRLGA